MSPLYKEYRAFGAVVHSTVLLLMRPFATGLSATEIVAEGPCLRSLSKVFLVCISPWSISWLGVPGIF